MVRVRRQLADEIAAAGCEVTLGDPTWRRQMGTTPDDVVARGGAADAMIGAIIRGVTIDGAQVALSLRPAGNGVEVTSEGAVRRATFAQSADAVTVYLNGAHEFGVVDAPAGAFVGSVLHGRRRVERERDFFTPRRSWANSGHVPCP